MKRMLINATHTEEMRVAIVDGQKLHDLDIENKSRQQKKSNIYKAKITRIEPSLEAAFVDYGADRHGFLPFKEIAREYLSEDAFKGGGRPNVKDGIREGKEIIVQIEKEERGNKGAALTTFISLAGRFLVLMPNNPRAGGVSRRIEGEDRANLRAAMNDVNVGNDMGTIVRTAGIGRTTEELQWDLDYQVEIWKAIQRASEDKKAPFLIYQESNVIVRALRDNFRSDIGEILIDAPEVHAQAEEFIARYMPHNSKKLKLYQETIPLFSRYQIESQIESAFQREVQLPSGGAIVIDHTEALISIDINSARATKGSDIEETATNTNLEACDEVARQLRLRDNGGLIVIDFIDMLANKNQRKVEARLKEVMKVDRARVQIGRISRFGLMEMSRQRLRPSLGESSQGVCPRCSGQGTIRGVESLGLSILRLLEEEAMKDNTGRVMVQVPVDVGSYLVNEKRENIAEIESRTGAQLLVVPSPGLETPHFNLERIRNNDQDHEAQGKKSYELSINIDEPYVPGQIVEKQPVGERPAVTRVVPDQPAPTPSADRLPAKAGLAPEATVVTKIIGAFSSLFSSEAKEKDKPAEEETTTTSKKPRNSGNNQKRGNRSGNQNNAQGKGGNKRKGKTQKKTTSKTDAVSNDESPKSSDKQGEENNGKEKRSRSRNNRRNTQNKRNQSDKNRNENEVDKDKVNTDSAVSTDTKAPASDNQSETNTDKPGKNNRRQKQGSNYNRSRRQNNRDENSDKDKTSESTSANDKQTESESGKPVEKAPVAASNTNSEEKVESASTTSESTRKPPNNATASVTGEAGNKPSQVSTKQPSQLKSTVRSLANKSPEEKQSRKPVEKQEATATETADKPEATQADSKPKSRGRGRPPKSKTVDSGKESVSTKDSVAKKSETANTEAAKSTEETSKPVAKETAETVAQTPEATKPAKPAKEAPRASWGSPKPAAAAVAQQPKPKPAKTQMSSADTAVKSSSNKPAESPASAKPAERSASAKSAESSASTKPAESSASAKPAESSASTKPAESSASAKPAESSATTKSAESSAATKPAASLASAEARTASASSVAPASVTASKSPVANAKKPEISQN